ncbi:MAG: hypothetical protein M3R36_14820 [Bacteroidota bacterium]|nr:hypothetical protein [Bacteroidota bacterium]
MDSEEKYSDIREKLRNLEQVKAGDNFVHNLHHKIVELEAGKRKMHFKKFDEGKGGFLKNLLANRQYPWLIPAVGFTMVIFFVLYMTFVSKNASENNKEISSTQKSDQTQNKSKEQVEANENKELTSTPEQSNSNSGKKTLPKEDIADNLKKEQGNKSLSQFETRNQKTDGDDPKDKSNKTKTFAQNNNEKSNLSKQNSDHQNIEESRLTETEKSTKESTFAKGTTEETSSYIATEDETQSRKLIEKLNAIDKVNLESLRDKISNN